MTDTTHFFGKISLSVPPSWIDNTVINLVGPPVGSFRPNIAVTRQVVPPTVSLSMWGKQQAQFLQQSGLLGFEVQTEDIVYIEQQKFYLFAYSWNNLLDPNTNPPQMDHLFQAQYTTLNDGIAYTLTFTCAKDSAQELELLCEDIVASFRVA